MSQAKVKIIPIYEFKGLNGEQKLDSIKFDKEEEPETNHDNSMVDVNVNANVNEQKMFAQTVMPNKAEVSNIIPVNKLTNNWNNNYTNQGNTINNWGDDDDNDITEQPKGKVITDWNNDDED